MVEAVIFVGIQASGKSTFYLERFYKTHVRINLDMLKTRHREDILLEACLRARQSFVVDNTNVTRAERSKYILLAKPTGFRIMGYYFQTGLAEALERNQNRADKEVIPAQGVQARWRQLELPAYEEGFDELYSVSIVDGKFIIQEWRDG